jgi:MFS family permease
VLSPLSLARGLPSQASEYFGLVRSGEESPRLSWGVLRRDNRNFRWYFCGSVTSDFGTWLQNTAQVLLAYRLAHSVLAVGLVTFAQFSSPLVLGPWAGVMADRFGGRRTLLGTQIASAAIAAALAGLGFGGLLTEWWLVAGAILSGLSFTFALPARNVTVQGLVPAAETRPAYIMDAVSYNLGRALAPLLTIAVGATHFNYAWAFGANAFSFGVFTVILSRVRQQGTEERKVRSRVLDGFMFARRDGEILILLLMVAAVTVADDPVLVLGPALANQLHVDPSWSGWFIAALGGGSVLGSLRPSMHLITLRLAATALALLGGCMAVFVLAPTIFARDVAIWFSVAAAFGAGVSCLIANSVTRTLLSKHAGPQRVAAVMAVWAVAWAGSKPFASLTDGLLAGWVGLQWTGLILAIPAFMPIVVITLMPQLGHRLANFRSRALNSQQAPEADSPPACALVG